MATKKKASKKAKTQKEQAAKFKSDQAAKLKKAASSAGTGKKTNGKDTSKFAKPKRKSKKQVKADKAAKVATDRNESAKKRVKSAKIALERSRNYAASGLAAQVTETLIDEIRALDKPWHNTPEAEQAVVIARLSDRVYNAMQNAVQVMSAIGHKAVICNLFSVTFKDGVRAVVTVAPGSQMRHELADYATRDVVLVLSDPGVFMQGLQDIKPDADQPKLI